MLKKSFIALSIISTLSACSIDLGADEEQSNKTQQIHSAELIGRTVLNTQSPEGAAEIVDYDKTNHHIYAINSSGENATVEILSASNINRNALTKNSEGVVTGNTGTGVNLPKIATIDLTANTTGDANSLAISTTSNLLAVAIAAKTTGEKGNIAFYDISGATPSFIKNVAVGYLPDMVTFSQNGKYAVVANEGEPSGDYSIDPEGSISIIEIINNVPADTATMLDFSAYNTQKSELESQGIKFANPGVSNGQPITVAQDLEPEYVTITQDSTKAFVAMQENNAIAVVDLTTQSITNIFGLGFKNWANYDIDVSNKDDANFKRYTNLYGMYQPDTIASYTVNNKHYIVTANEGDAREYIDDMLSGGATEDENKTACETKHPNGHYDFDDGEELCFSYIEEYRVKDLEDVAPLSANLNTLLTNNGDKDGLGRLKVTQALGMNHTVNEYQNLYAFGARSFSIFDETGNLIFDSGDDFEKYTFAQHGEAFNNDEDENKGDARSDDKGPEPESVAIGEINGNTYAFIGLERMGGIFIYNINDPAQPKYEHYFINRGLVEDEVITGDLAPEGMKFVPAADSPTGEALLIIGNEISGSVAVWEIK